MQTKVPYHDETHYNRAERFDRILAGYEADGPDGSVPGATRPEILGGTMRHPRYVVMTESERGFGYFANLAATLDDVATVAAANIHESWQPVCYFDLDELAGDEPILVDGDHVTYRGESRVVSHHDYEAHEGEPYAVVYLEPIGMDDDDPEGPIDQADEELTLAERAEPDERMPVRYGLAKIVTTVVFNSIPQPA